MTPTAELILAQIQRAVGALTQIQESMWLSTSSDSGKRFMMWIKAATDWCSFTPFLNQFLLIYNLGPFFPLFPLTTNQTNTEENNLFIFHVNRIQDYLKMALCQKLHLTAVSDHGIALTFSMPGADRDYLKTTVPEEIVLQAIPQQGFQEHSSCQSKC